MTPKSSLLKGSNNTVVLLDGQNNAKSLKVRFGLASDVKFGTKQVNNHETNANKSFFAEMACIDRHSLLAG